MFPYSFIRSGERIIASIALFPLILRAIKKHMGWDNAEDDYAVLDDDKSVGRIYRKHGEDRWLWSVNMSPFPAPPPNNGLTSSLEEAKTAVQGTIRRDEGSGGETLFRWLNLARCYHGRNPGRSARSAARPSSVSTSRPRPSRRIRPLTVIVVTVSPVTPEHCQSVPAQIAEERDDEQAACRLSARDHHSTAFLCRRMAHSAPRS